MNLRLLGIPAAILMFCASVVQAATVTVDASVRIINDSVTRSFTLSGSITPSTAEVGTISDIYVAVKTPSGELLTYGDNGWTSEIAPVVRGWLMSDLTANDFLKIEAPLGTALGDYEFWIVVAKGGSQVLDERNWVGIGNSVVTLKPLIVYGSSYENMKIGASSQLVFPNLDVKRYEEVLAFAEADFFQTGEQIIFAAKQRYNTLEAYEDVVKDPRKYWSELKFYRKEADGTLMETGPTFIGCMHPRKAVVADFNNDSYPDIFLGCTGFDGPKPPNIPNTFGEKFSTLLLSDGKGSFNLIEVDVAQGTSQNPSRPNAYVHGVTAFDVNGDRLVDLVIADAASTNGLYVLINEGKGNFRRDNSKFPSIGKSYYISVEGFDINADGIIDIIAGSGNELAADSPTKIFYGDERGFGFSKTEIIPPVAGRGVILDFTFLRDKSDTHVYVGRTADELSGLYYGTSTLQKYSVKNRTSITLFDEGTKRYGAWVAWWIPNFVNGQWVLSSYQKNSVGRPTPWVVTM